MDEIMKISFKKSGVGGGLLAAAFLLNGCAFTKDHVSINYVPHANITRTTGAETVTVNVSVADLRATKDKVSTKKNGYGMETAPILADNDVAEVLKGAIESELKQRGFHVGRGSVVVLAELSKFYCDFKTGIWAGDAVAEMTMNVQVKRPDGTIACSTLIYGQGVEPNIQLASGKNAQLALDAALQDAVAKLFMNSAFVDSLLQSNKPAQLQAGLAK